VIRNLTIEYAKEGIRFKAVALGVVDTPMHKHDSKEFPKTSSVITSKAANGYHFKTGQRDWPSGTENVLSCRLLWWQVGFGAPAPRAAFEHVAVVQ
jgi:NAD(P)-dependent dehydrogenase (short-subunit alcohol dehydrogenase family)